MNAAMLSVVCLCVLSGCLVTSTPVYPTMPIRNYTPVDACLFMCNVCYDQRITKMMDCANNICLSKNGYEMVIGLIKLGRVCKYKNTDGFAYDGDNKTE